jgi:hypothetical protein
MKGVSGFAPTGTKGVIINGAGAVDSITKGKPKLEGVEGKKLLFVADESYITKADVMWIGSRPSI